MIDKLIEGEYYISEKWLWLQDNRQLNWKRSGKGISISDFSEYYDRLFQTNYDETPVRLATPEERAWLDACILTGKFVKKPQNTELVYAVF